MAARLADPRAGLVRVGRSFFAVALMGLAIEHFAFRQFVTGRAPAWPESIPGGPLWAYLTGIVFLLAGAAILAGKEGRLAAALAGGLILLGALLPHLPALAKAQVLSGEWTRAGKALVFVGGALAIAATFPKLEARRASRLLEVVNRRSQFLALGRVCLGLFFVVTGTQHFLFTEFVASLIPAWFPGDSVA